MWQGKISVLIPAFKSAFLKKCIDSILSQDYENFEVVVVNDNSPENLESIVDQYSDIRIKYHKNEVGFGGKDVVNNWNKCLDISSGEYVICMGDDDMLKPDALSLYVDAINKYPEYDIFHIRTEIIDENDKIIDLQIPLPERESVYSMIYNLWKGRDQFIGDYLFKSSALKANGGFYYLPFAWSSDKISTFVVAGNKGIININNIGFRYRRTSITISNSCTTQRDRYDALLGEKQWYEEFINSQVIIEDDLDNIYFNLIKRNLVGYMEHRLNAMLLWDIYDSPSHILYWLKRRKQYDFSRIYCLRIIYKTLGACKTKLLKPIIHHC